MQWKQIIWSVVAVLFPVSGQICSSQVVYSAHSGLGQSLSIGIGPSSYNVDWGHGRMLGGTVWANWYPHQMPRLFYGLGVEVEARDISLNRSSDQPSNLRQDTIGGGAIYSWPHYRSVHPYAKGLISYGSMDFISKIPGYSHDSRSVYTAGGGVDFRAFGPLWARVDYEYQAWPNLFSKTSDPQGFTVGVAYAFGSGGFRH